MNVISQSETREKKTETAVKPHVIYLFIYLVLFVIVFHSIDDVFTMDKLVSQYVPFTQTDRQTDSIGERVVTATQYQLNEHYFSFVNPLRNPTLPPLGFPYHTKF